MSFGSCVAAHLGEVGVVVEGKVRLYMYGWSKYGSYDLDPRNRVTW